MTAKRQPTLSLAECHRKRVVVVCAELLLALKHLLRRDVNIARAHPEFWTLQTAVSRLPASLVRRCIVVINVLSLNTNCQTRNWVIRSPGQWAIFHVRVTESSFWPGVRPEIFRFSKKCPKCKTYIWNAEMTKVIARCLLLDWNHWMSVHAMNFYLYVWLLKIRTPLHISRYLECIIEQSPGQLGRWIPGSLGHKMWPSSMSAVLQHSPSINLIRSSNCLSKNSKPHNKNSCRAARTDENLQRNEFRPVKPLLTQRHLFHTNFRISHKRT